MRKLFPVLCCLFPVAVLAFPPHPGGHPPPGQMGMPPMHHSMEKEGCLPPFLQSLNLSEKQQDEIKNLLKSHRVTMDEAFKKEHDVMKQLRQLSFSSEYSEEKAADLITKTVVMRKNQALQQTKLDNDIYKLLTGEQQAKLKTEMDKMDDPHPF